MGFLEERDLTNEIGIREFYKGKTVFITGGTGFMGELLIEKLLYSCSDLDRIYILVRPKKGIKPEDRVNEICKEKCFDRLRKEKPGILESKLFGISGDMMELGLGISEEDRTLLINRCNIVFHVAASVRFDDPLSFATKLNLRGSREVVELVKEIRNLCVLVHVSTSYSNTNRSVIEEKMYPPHADWRETIKIVENTDEHLLRIMTAKYLGEIPNTYTFTKQLAEHVMYEQRGKLPIVIMRPSIALKDAVDCTLEVEAVGHKHRRQRILKMTAQEENNKETVVHCAIYEAHGLVFKLHVQGTNEEGFEEPIPGWIVNFNGPVGLIAASGKGIMRSIYSDPDIVADHIPVDIAIKCFIAASWIRGVKHRHPFPSDILFLSKRLATHSLYLWGIEGLWATDLLLFSGSHNTKSLNYHRIVFNSISFIPEGTCLDPGHGLEPTDDIPIYNCCAGDLNYMTMKEIVEFGKSLISEIPVKDSLWHVGGDITTSRTVHYVKVLLLHLLPAIFVDAVLCLLGRKPMLVKIQRRIYIANLALEYYITRSWKFNNRNFITLRDKIKEGDRKDFFYLLQEIDKYDYFRKAVAYGNRYLFKQTEEDEPEARRHYQRMELFVKCLLYADDQVIILALSAYWLQKMVNKMNNSIKKRGVKVNVGNSKVMVFERGESTTEWDILIEGERVE
ncbi:Putative fatty acyl-CoA reductase CG5065 [Eumeta japonica]|uniref:Fatty acyl-CoA reductase n=1 Tax=Eumeta variegata TaxID=151549 RepID=A0A4C1WZW0_EUMVA|nr:Putative fatty acyl-CoA reductase CG5065 [Eumeta japonica]